MVQLLELDLHKAQAALEAAHPTDVATVAAAQTSVRVIRGLLRDING